MIDIYGMPAMTAVAAGASTKPSVVTPFADDLAALLESAACMGVWPCPAVSPPMTESLVGQDAVQVAALDAGHHPAGWDRPAGIELAGLPTGGAVPIRPDRAMESMVEPTAGDGIPMMGVDPAHAPESTSDDVSDTQAEGGSGLPPDLQTAVAVGAGASTVATLASVSKRDEVEIGDPVRTGVTPAGPDGVRSPSDRPLQSRTPTIVGGTRPGLSPTRVWGEIGAPETPVTEAGLRTDGSGNGRVTERDALETSGSTAIVADLTPTPDSDRGAPPTVERTDTPAAAVERIMRWVREAENLRPPRSLEVHLPDMDGVVITVSLREGGLHLEVAGAGSGERLWLEELTGALSERGFDLDGGYDGDSSRRGMTRPQGDEETPLARSTRRVRHGSYPGGVRL